MTSPIKMPLLRPTPPLPEIAELTSEERNVWTWITEKASYDAMLINLTPRLARLLLERVGQNRKVVVATIQRYARAMAEKQWRLTHQGIGVSTMFEVIDGQHRLRAVMESQATIEILLVRGVPQDSILQLDGGRIRTDAEAIRISDIALRDLEPIEATSAKRMMKGARRFMRPVLREDLRAFILKHRDPIRLVCRELWRQGRVPNVTHSEIVAVLARASYHCQRDDLLAAIGFFASGTGQGEASRYEPLLVLREWLMKARPHDMVSRYGKASRAMRAFIDGEKVGRRLTESREELFTLPGERTAEG